MIIGDQDFDGHIPLLSNVTRERTSPITLEMIDFGSGDRIGRPSDFPIQTQLL
jgi:hypothetical protein